MTSEYLRIRAIEITETLCEFCMHPIEEHNLGTCQHALCDRAGATYDMCGCDAVHPYKRTMTAMDWVRILREKYDYPVLSALYWALYLKQWI